MGGHQEYLPPGTRSRRPRHLARQLQHLEDVALRGVWPCAQRIDGGVLALHARLAQALDHLVGDLDLAVELHSRAGGDQPAHDDALLEAAQVVHLAADRGLGEHARRLLEARGRDERVRAERGLGDAEQQRVAARRLLGAKSVRPGPTLLALQRERVEGAATQSDVCPPLEDSGHCVSA